MSDNVKNTDFNRTTEAGRKAQPGQDAASAALQAAARAARPVMAQASEGAARTVDQASEGAARTVDQAKEAGETIVKTVERTTDAATDISRRVADQGREVMLLGVRTAAGVNSRIADINYDRGQDLMTSAARAMDVYCGASESAAENMQALFASYLTLGCGIQRMQHAWLDMLGQAVEHATHKPQDLLRCKSLVEFAEVQRDLYVGAISHAFESSSTLLDLAGQTARDAMRPLHARRDVAARA
jgi:hypothetical protein